MVQPFEETRLKGMVLANRFVRSATWEGMAGDDGSASPRLSEYMRQLALGHLGLIITSHAYVHPSGQAGPWQLGIHRDELIPGLSNLAREVHKSGGKIVIQLAHAGCFASGKLIGRTPLAVSDVPGIVNSPRQVMNEDNIGEIVQAFAEGARRAKEAGFDGVEIHGAHGYLISQFLSPAFNLRTDRFGGPIENRARIAIEVLRAIRRVVGEDYPVLIKLNCGDFIENGLSQKDAIAAGKLLWASGIDAVELSGGVLTGGKLSPSRPGINSEEKEAYFRKEAEEFRKQVPVPLILVGGIRSYTVAENLIASGIADYAALSRPLIREPHLIKRWQEGNRLPASCVSDNQCFAAGLMGKGISCVL